MAMGFERMIWIIWFIGSKVVIIRIWETNITVGFVKPKKCDVSAFTGERSFYNAKMDNINSMASNDVRCHSKIERIVNVNKSN